MVATVGGGVIYLVTLPALWRMSWPYGVCSSDSAQLGAAVSVTACPARRRILFAAAAALGDGRHR
ncbi:MAG: hypothetical protein M3334_03030 [Actinomycetota bacterium]|nr:hypothetical protein [Actinomycetota bacterium]